MISSKIPWGPWVLLCKFCFRTFPNMTETLLIWGRTHPRAVLARKQITYYVLLCFVFQATLYHLQLNLIALWICVCVRFVWESISWDNLAAILNDNISKDSASPSGIAVQLLYSMFLIVFHWDELPLLGKDSKSWCLSGQFITSWSSLSQELEFPSSSLTSMLP